MSERNSLFTNNVWENGNGSVFQSVNPANGKLLWQGRSCTPLNVAEAIKNANKAFEGWSGLSVDERSLFLDTFKKIILDRQNELAELISKENGKPLWDSHNEVSSIINKVSISLESYGQRCAGIIHQLPSAKSITRHRPHGAVGILGPYNFPGHTPSGHIIPALLAGNTVVFKPSELTPLVGEYLANCWLETGLPAGVFNLIQGGRETGQALVENKNIKGIFFTGSYPTGRKISEYFGPFPEKILALEMGGNNPLIIEDIQDPTAAAYLTIQSAYLSAGQRCTCARRLIVIKNPSNEIMLAKLMEMAKQIRVGGYEEKPEPFMGPVISDQRSLGLLMAQDHLIQLGGKALIEMKHLKPGTGLLSPGLMDVTDITDLPDEEYFGPFLQLIWVNNLEEAVQKANQTMYGLTAGLFSSHSDSYGYFYNHIQAGLISWNMPITGANSSAPFGGIKCSGNHRPSAYYAADYCAYPVASMESSDLKLPLQLAPGIEWHGKT
jgi:succinylglutamic semialdehyde dehydrogenase